jgi:hypothetical protein
MLSSPWEMRRCEGSTDDFREEKVDRAADSESKKSGKEIGAKRSDLFK